MAAARRLLGVLLLLGLILCAHVVAAAPGKAEGKPAHSAKPAHAGKAAHTGKAAGDAPHAGTTGKHSAAKQGTQRFRNTIVICLAVIIVMTILFEVATHMAVHRVDHHMRGMLEALFKELTVLGFIAFTVFLSVSTHIPQHFSEVIFGTPSELIHMFEFFHILVFLIMVLYISVVVISMYRVRESTSAFASHEKQLGDYRVAAALGEVDSEMPAMTKSARDYQRLRSLFLRGRESLSVQAGSDFDFAEYLNSRMGHLFTEVVEIDKVTWFLMLFLLVCVRVYMSIPSENVKLVLFWLFGAGILGVFMMLKRKLADIRFQLTGMSADSVDEPVGDEESRKYGTMAGATLPYIVSPPKPVGLSGNRLHKFLTNGVAPNAQERLFPGFNRGPELMLHAIRTSLLLVGVYLAMMLFRFGNHFHYGGAVFVLYISLPAYAVWAVVPSVLVDYLVVTSIELSTSNKDVRKVKSEQAMKREESVKRVQRSLMAHAQFLSARGSPPRSPPPPMQLDDDAMRAFRDAFALYDVHDSATINTADVPKLLKTMGIAVDTDRLQLLYIECGLDGSQVSIAAAQTLVALAQQPDAPRPPSSVGARALFMALDRAASGTLTTGQLRGAIPLLFSTVSSADVDAWMLDNSVSSSLEVSRFVDIICSE